LNQIQSVVIHTDGASRGNPGPAAIGVVITDPDGLVLVEMGEALAPTTNNVAEYTAVIRALERAAQLGAKRVQVRMDSQLVVRQLNGSYRVKHADMLPLYRRVLELIKGFDEVTFEHVPREQNVEADRLANLALDRRGETPEGTVGSLVKLINEGRWAEAEAMIGPDFKYRRANHPPQAAAAFLDAWKGTSAIKVEAGSARVFGSEILIEALASGKDGPEIAVLWICRVDDGKVEEIIEYRDAGS
jgi:ribonuclease HI